MIFCYFNRYIPRPSLVDSVGRGNSNATFPSMLPAYIIPSPATDNNSFTSGMQSSGNMNNLAEQRVPNNCPPHMSIPAPTGYPPMSSIMITPNQAFIQSQGE